jgi:hypothetical protein
VRSHIRKPYRRPGAEPLPVQSAELKRVAPGVFELTIAHHDFALILVE